MSDLVQQRTLCRCCHRVRSLHPRSTVLCSWCYLECTNEGCTDGMFEPVHWRAAASGETPT